MRARGPPPRITIADRTIACRLWRRLARNGSRGPLLGIDSGDVAEISQDRGNLLVGELNLGHVAVARTHAFRETLLQLVDRVFELDLAQRWRLWQRTFTSCIQRMTAAALRFEDDLAINLVAVRRDDPRYNERKRGQASKQFANAERCQNRAFPRISPTHSLVFEQVANVAVTHGSPCPKPHLGDDTLEAIAAYDGNGDAKKADPGAAVKQVPGGEQGRVDGDGAEEPGEK